MLIHACTMETHIGVLFIYLFCNECAHFAFFFTAIQLNGPFWAASWTLCAPHKGEDRERELESQRAFSLAT